MLQTPLAYLAGLVAGVPVLLGLGLGDVRLCGAGEMGETGRYWGWVRLFGGLKARFASGRCVLRWKCRGWFLMAVCSALRGYLGL